jgi:uridine kinase
MSEGKQQPGVSPVVLAIAGCSGSGKTTLARRLVAELGGVHFHFDNYYRDLKHLSWDQRVRLNFDDPALLEESLLLDQLAALCRGEWIHQPVYDFTAHTRQVGELVRLRAERLLVVEGIFALYFKKALPLYHLRVFVEAPEPVCLARRIERDTRERGRCEMSVRTQWTATVAPSAERFVRPTVANDDVIVDGYGDLERELEAVMAELQRRGVLARLRGESIGQAI